MRRDFRSVEPGVFISARSHALLASEVGVNIFFPPEWTELFPTVTRDVRGIAGRAFA